MRRPGRKSQLSELQIGDPNHSYAYAIALLARRDHSARELRHKLKERGYIEIAIEPVVLELEASNKLNDQRYGANVVAYRAGRGQGPARIRHELKKSGLSAEAIATAVDEGEDAPDFVALARAARIRKFGPEIPGDWKERAKQARFLQYRGFSNDHIRAVLEGAPDEESGLDSGSESDQS
jgi:regulatory protein